MVLLPFTQPNQLAMPPSFEDKTDLQKQLPGIQARVFTQLFFEMPEEKVRPFCMQALLHLVTFLPCTSFIS